MAMKRNLEIDKLRAVAIILTVYSHLDFFLLYQPNWYKLSIKYFFNGSNGVILFFAISGYVISKSFLPLFDNSIKKLNEQLIYCKSFLIRRWYRLTPMAYLWILIPLVLTIIFNKHGAFGVLNENIKGAISSFLYSYNIFNVFNNGKSMYGVFWSLALEEQFYLIFPIFCIFFKTSNQRIISLIFFLLFLNLIPDHVRMGFRLEAIILGVILYLIECKKVKLNIDWNFKKFYKYMITFSLIFLLSFPLLTKINIYLKYYEPAIISVILVWIASLEHNIIFPCKKLSYLLDWIGTRSYGIYLIHIPVLRFTAELSYSVHIIHSLFIRSLIILLIGFICVEGCYKYLELPLRIKGKNISNKSYFLYQGK